MTARIGKLLPLYLPEFPVVVRRNSYGIYRHIGRDDELKRCG